MHYAKLNFTQRKRYTILSHLCISITNKMVLKERKNIIGTEITVAAEEKSGDIKEVNEIY